MNIPHAIPPTTSNTPSILNFLFSSQYSAHQPRQSFKHGYNFPHAYLHSFSATSVQIIISFLSFSPLASSTQVRSYCNPCNFTSPTHQFPANFLVNFFPKFLHAAFPPVHHTTDVCSRQGLASNNHISLPVHLHLSIYSAHTANS